MNSTHLPTNAAVSPDSGLVKLARHGVLLDAADARQIALSARLYREAAVRAKTLIRKHIDEPALREVCSEFESLTQLLSNVWFELEREAGLGTARPDLSRFQLPRA